MKKEDNTKLVLVDEVSFKPRTRILALLGEQLIGSPQLAVFELVKNAYDADASSVSVELTGLDSSQPQLIVRDDGEGMSLNILRDVWMEPAADHREKQRNDNIRSKKFKRLPLGEKGVGRFAVHKLGKEIVLVTREKNQPEYVIRINWDKLINSAKHLENAPLMIHRRTQPKIFKGNKHGTRIAVGDLRDKNWTRGDVRRLQRMLTALNSPFEEAARFTTILTVPEHPGWLGDIPDVPEILSRAPWQFEFQLIGDEFSYKYHFVPPPKVRVQKRDLESDEDKLKLPVETGSRKKVIVDSDIFKGIGPIKGRFAAYDRDRKILKLYPLSTMYTKFLDHWSGVRVYRDGMRVFIYGEPEDDWLSLDMRRVNRPTERLSRNIIVGAVHLDLQHSKALTEKTNREGFHNNEAFDRFRELVTAVISHFEVERALDKDRLKRFLESKQDDVSIPVETPLRALRDGIENSNLAKRLMPYVQRVEKDFEEMKELFLKSGMAGLNLALIIHEVERGIRTLYQSIKIKDDPVRIETQARQLVHMFENVTGLLKKKRDKFVDIRKIVQSAAELNVRRFERHNIRVTYDLPDEDDLFVVKASYDLLLSSINNLIDNSLYWLRVRWPDVEPGGQRRRRLHIFVSGDLDNGRSLVVADNGTGFQDDEDLLTRPFFTRRPEGSGLGLYYASLALELNGAELRFPQDDDFELPKGINGALVALYFPKGKVK